MRKLDAELHIDATGRRVSIPLRDWRLVVRVLVEAGGLVARERRAHNDAWLDWLPECVDALNAKPRCKARS